MHLLIPPEQVWGQEVVRDSVDSLGTTDDLLQYNFQKGKIMTLGQKQTNKKYVKDFLELTD